MYCFIWVLNHFHEWTPKGLLSSLTCSFDMHWALCLLNAGYVSIFVIISASWLSVSTHAKSMTSFRHQYRITWCLISTCLVRFVIIKFVDMLIATWLSSWKITGSSSSMFSSLRHDRNQMSELHPRVVVLHSATPEDCAD